MTLYSIIGYLFEYFFGVKEKWVDLVGFSYSEDNVVEITVYCVNHHSEAQTLEGREWRDFQKLRFHRNGGNIRIDVGKIPPGWKVIGTIKEELDYEAIWQTGWDRCKFVLEQTSSNETALYLELKCQQTNSNTDLSKTLKVKQEVQREDEKIYLFPLDLRRYICGILDTEDKIHQRDWTQIAMHQKGLKLHWTEIRYLKDLKESAGKSPTQYLLNEWEQRGYTVQQFEDLMNQMGMSEIVDKIRKFRSEEIEVVYSRTQS